MIGKKEFVVGALDSEYKVFLVYVAAFCVDSRDKVHPLKRTQIANLKADESPVKVPSEYANFPDIFSLNLGIKLPKHTRINNHAIELVEN